MCAAVHFCACTDTHTQQFYLKNDVHPYYILAVFFFLHIISMCMLHSFDSGILLIVMIFVNSIVVPVMAYSRSGYPSRDISAWSIPIQDTQSMRGIKCFD